jgi:hypothetical protein
MKASMATTTAQLLANRHNAAFSTGPRTTEGKAASARNATRHGLSSAFTVLAHEDQAEFDRLLQDLRAYYRPQNVIQGLLVDQMAKSQWLLARAQRLQTVAYNLLAGIEDQADPDARIVAAMRDANSDVLARLDRYAASAERSFHRAHRELTAARKKQIAEDFDRAFAKTNEEINRAINAPLPVRPLRVNHPLPAAQNEPNRRRLTDAELALRL